MQDNVATEGQLHYMQTSTWAEVKQQFGWKPESLQLESVPVVAVIYKRRVPAVGNLLYAPGIAGLTSNTVDAFTHELLGRYKNKAFGVRLELNQRYDAELLDSLQQAGWLKTSKHVQYRHTVTLDLTPAEEILWMSLKSRGRYEVLQAKKFGVRIEEAKLTDENLDKMYELMQLTSTRNKFYIRDKQFTMAYWHAFQKTNHLRLFFAWHKGDLLSGAIILTNGTLAWYKDGGSTRTQANLMGARLLQWEAMKTLKKEGITVYDLGGIPDPKSHQNSSMHGIYVFKTAYSKTTVELMSTLELPLSRHYGLWSKTEKQWLRIYNLFAHSLWY